MFQGDKMIKIAIIDDDTNDIDVLNSHILRYQKENSIDIEVKCFESGLHFMMDYDFECNVFLVDIRMPNMNGIELAEFIRKKSPNAIIIFVTNLEHFAIRGYEVDAFDYWVKPIDYFLFSYRMRCAIEILENLKNTQLVISTEDEKCCILSSDVVYVEVDDHWLTIHTSNNTFQMIGTLKSIEEKLTETYFIKSKKNAIVNLRFVTHLNASTLTLVGGEEVGIARARRKAVKEALLNYYNTYI